MYGFTIQKTIGKEYTHLYFEIYHKFNVSEKWERIGAITFQTDKGNDHWYGFSFEKYGHGYDSLNLFCKFAQKVLKVWNETPENILTWLQNMRGMKQLVYDTRLQEYVTIDEYEKTKHLTPYKVYINSQYYMDVLAMSPIDAENEAIKYFMKHSPTYARKWAEIGYVEEKNHKPIYNIPNVEELLAI